MAAKKSGLGRGIEALFSTPAPESSGNVEKTKQTKDNSESEASKKNIKTENASKSQKNESPDRKQDVNKESDHTAEEKPDLMIAINKISVNKNQPRKQFDEEALAELAASIKEHGVIQPLVVVQRGAKYQIVAGERRYRAAKMAGISEVPVIIRDLSDEEIMEISLIENLQREDLNPIEEALAYQKLMKQFNMTQDQLSQKVSKSRTLIANTVRLLKLDDVIQQMVIDRRISSGHARALLGLEDQLDIYDTAQKVINEALSVRQTEDLVRLINEKKNKPVIEPDHEEDNEQINLIYAKYEETLRDLIGTKVNIKRKKNQKGKIEIEYYNLDDLDRIFALLGTLNKQEA